MHSMFTIYNFASRHREIHDYFESCTEIVLCILLLCMNLANFTMGHVQKDITVSLSLAVLAAKGVKKFFVIMDTVIQKRIRQDSM